MNSVGRLSAALSLCGALLVPMLGQAAVQVAGTRFVYPAKDREVVVNLNNQGDSPALVQSWLDSGDSNAQPGAEKLPFLVLPPLARVDARKGQALRITRIGEGLPQDRESVFWLNVLEIPPKARGVERKNVMQLAFRTRLKLFYRPEGLKGTAKQAAEGLAWSLVPVAAGYALRASNVSAYHVSFAKVMLHADGKSYNNVAGGMVAPHGSQDFPLEGLRVPVASGTIEGHWLNDFGADQEQSYDLQR